MACMTCISDSDHMGPHSQEMYELRSNRLCASLILTIGTPWEITKDAESGLGIAM